MKGLPIVFFLSLAFAAAQPAYAQDSKWRVITEQGISHYEKGEYDRAVAAIKKSLAVAEKEYGPDHPETATSLNNLAELYRAATRRRLTRSTSARLRYGKNHSDRIMRLLRQP